MLEIPESKIISLQIGDVLTGKKNDFIKKYG